MKKLFLYSFIFFFIAVLKAQPGSLDPDFGNNGIAIFQPGDDHDVGYDVICLDDNSMLICGVYEPYGVFQGFQGILMKLQEDGSPDPAFGDNGTTIIDFGSYSIFTYEMELLDDGKILISGLIYFEEFNAEFFLARYLPDGTIDTSFGTNGYSVAAYSTSEDYCHAMLVQDDGKIVLAGRTWESGWSSILFTRFTADGNHDTSFGNNGYTVIDESPQDETVLALGELSNGTIVGVGDGYVGNPQWGQMAIMVKLDHDGNPISTFGSNGVLTPPIFTDGSKAYAIDVINDDLYITGYVYGQTQGTDLFITKLDEEGNADTDFGDNGIFVAPLNPTYYNNIGLDILISPDEYIYVCGSAGYDAFTLDFILLRCSLDGVLDPQFNGNGYTVTQVGVDFEEANALDLQADGKIVLAGFKADFSAANDIVVARYIGSEVITLNPPTNLYVDTYTGLFTWDAPVADDLTGYDVYLDGVFVGNTSELQWQYSDLINGAIYEAGLAAVYDEGTSAMVTLEFIYEGTGAGNNLPLFTELKGNYPNPFNPTTTIAFGLNQVDTVELIIYNIKGEKVRTLVSSELEAGYHNILWNGKDDSGKTTSSGVYFYKMKAGDYQATKKMILMK